MFSLHQRKLWRSIQILILGHEVSQILFWKPGLADILCEAAGSAEMFLWRYFRYLQMVFSSCNIYHLIKGDQRSISDSLSQNLSTGAFHLLEHLGDDVMHLLWTHFAGCEQEWKRKSLWGPCGSPMAPVDPIDPTGPAGPLTWTDRTDQRQTFPIILTVAAVLSQTSGWQHPPDQLVKLVDNLSDWSEKLVWSISSLLTSGTTWFRAVGLCQSGSRAENKPGSDTVKGPWSRAKSRSRSRFRFSSVSTCLSGPYDLTSCLLESVSLGRGQGQVTGEFQFQDNYRWGAFSVMAVGFTVMWVTETLNLNLNLNLNLLHTILNHKRHQRTLVTFRLHSQNQFETLKEVQPGSDSLRVLLAPLRDNRPRSSHRSRSRSRKSWTLLWTSWLRFDWSNNLNKASLSAAKAWVLVQLAP